MADAVDLEAELARRKELKVQVPTELYIKLHQNKILTGTLMSEMVTEALRAYMEEAMPSEDPGGDADEDEA
ncbi:MAG: hypothetical protein R3185_03565 [Candidatus Thermoplasmatota archaeon]|nr:hypothetical protein [Candidatus Thermoplasmatota archaeon]